MSKIRMGVKARDLLTGMEGIINQRLERFHGMSQWSLQPSRKDADAPDHYPDSYCFDENTLEYVGPGLEDRAIPADPSVEVELGDEVEERVSGYRGVAIVKATYLNGCVRFAVSQKVVTEKDGTQMIPKAEFFDHKLLRVVTAQKQTPERESSRGGPSEKVTW